MAAADPTKVAADPAKVAADPAKAAAPGGDDEAPTLPPPLGVRALLWLLAYPIGFLRAVGELTKTAARTIGWMLRPPYRLSLLLHGLAFIGVGSVFIILLTALTTGMVLGLQGVYSMRVFQAEAAVGGAVAMTLTREIGPVFTALMVTARASSAIATELGTMRVTDQIDALTTMGVNPVQYLIVPRVLAAAIMTPILSLLFVFVGMVGCYLVAVVWMNVDPGPFLDRIARWIQPSDFRQCLLKSLVFGSVTILIACHEGYSAKGGAAGVGQATTRAVVVGSVTIMVLDYALTAAML